MTSPSRRKRQTTVLSAPPAKSTDFGITHRATRNARALAARTLLGATLILAVPASEPVLAQQVPLQHTQKFVRPPRFSPPVHARPLQNRPVIAPHNNAPPQVRQVSAVQEFNSAPSLDFSDPTPQYVADEWRSRTQVRPPGQGQDAAPGQQVIQPSLNHPSPQTMYSGNNARQVPLQSPPGHSDMSWQNQAVAQPVLDALDRGPTQTVSQGSESGAMQWQTGVSPEHQGPANQYTQSFPQDRGSIDEPSGSDSTGHSVLVRPGPPAETSPEEVNRLRQQTTGSRRSLRLPQSLRGARSARYRKESARRPQEDFQPLEDFNNTQTDIARGRKSCEEFQAELLNTPITEIILDTAPHRPKTAAVADPAGGLRTWTDCEGNTLGTGTLVSMQRSYIVIRDNSGADQKISMSRLSDGDLALVTGHWALPTECSLGCHAFGGRNWNCNSVLWKASALCHKPLYYENIQLERYGHTHGPMAEPLYSTAHFFTSMIFWPYQTAIHPPDECVYSLGYYRPGDCAPWLKDPVPLSLRGTARQALFIGGAAAVLP